MSYPSPGLDMATIMKLIGMAAPMMGGGMPVPGAGAQAPPAAPMPASGPVPQAVPVPAAQPAPQAAAPPIAFGAVNPGFSTNLPQPAAGQGGGKLDIPPHLLPKLDSSGLPSMTMKAGFGAPAGVDLNYAPPPAQTGFKANLNSLMHPSGKGIANFLLDPGNAYAFSNILKNIAPQGSVGERVSGASADMFQSQQGMRYLNELNGRGGGTTNPFL